MIGYRRRHYENTYEPIGDRQRHNETIRDGPQSSGGRYREDDEGVADDGNYDDDT